MVEPVSISPRYKAVHNVMDISTNPLTEDDECLTKFERAHPVKITAMDVIRAQPLRLLDENRNWLAVICGPTGTGKTYTAIRVCEMVDPKFDVDRVAFSTQQLLDLFDCCGRRDIILFDEANAWNARTSNSKENVEFSKILAMLRFTQISILFTLPHIAMIDVNGRRLMHNYLYTIPINRKTCRKELRDKSGVYWYDVESGRLPMGNQKDIPLIFKHPYIRGEKISKVYFSLASPDLLEAYEERKMKWFKGMLASAKNKIAQQEAKNGNPVPMKNLPPLPAAATVHASPLAQPQGMGFIQKVENLPPPVTADDILRRSHRR